MDAVRFIKERNRMCKSLDVRCEVCPAFHVGENGAQCAVGAASMLDATAQIAIVEDWSAAHPRKTLQSVFLEQWPEAEIDKCGSLMLCPKLISADCRDRYGNCSNRICSDCRREFWMYEVE
jgi:hypothetical protein